MIKNQINLPIKGMNLAIDETVMPPDMARFIKGWEIFINENNSKDQSGGFQEGANQYVFTKNESNTQFATMLLQQGTGPTKAFNKAIGGGFVPETGKYYSCLYNSQGEHSVWELDCIKRTCTKVIQNSCLGFVYEPENFINPSTRFHYTIHNIINKDGSTSSYTWVVITDDNSRIKQLMIEDLIATSGLTHPFFKNNQCCSICDIITLGYPGRPKGCISITPVLRENTEEEKAKPNEILNNVFQFRLKHIDVWGRESLHGDISDIFYVSKSTSCTEDETHLTRCVELGFSGGCNTIKTIIVEYRICGTGNEAGLESNWKEHTRIEKYSDCDANGNYIKNFWERPLNKANTSGDVIYNQIQNTYTVKFCGGKLCVNIPTEETNIIANNIPNRATSVFQIGSKIGIAAPEFGFDANTCKQCDDIEISLIQDSTCNPFTYRKVEIWVVIYSVLDNEITNIRDFYPTNSSTVKTIGYGRAGKNNGSFSSTKDNPAYYNQVFNGTRGFTVYAVGHDNIYAITEQYDLGTGTPNKVGVMNYKSNGKILQKAEFLLPAGKYVFMIGDPMAGLTETIQGVSQGTPGIKYNQSSADVIGITPLANIGNILNEQYELFVDITTSDYSNLNTPLMVWDLTRDIKNILIPNNPQIVKGYLTDANSNLNGKYGVEMVELKNNNGSTFIHRPTRTDRNGHFFSTMKGTAIGGGDLELSLTGICPPLLASPPSIVLGTATPSAEFQAKNLSVGFFETREIKGKVLECDTNNPIPGMILILQNGGISKTDQNGEYSIKYHGYNGNRSGHEIVLNAGVCLWTNCTDPCSPLLENIIPVFKQCSDNSPIIPQNVFAKKADILLNSTIAQGKYSVGLVLEDCLQQTFVRCERTIEVGDTDDINSLSFDFGSVTFPNVFNHLSFYITENLSYSKWLEWAVDYAILEDNNGNISQGIVTIEKPAKMRIYLYSLIHYSAYTQSNTGWQFIDGDLINFRILANGKKINITRLVSYTPGDTYITIDYDPGTMSEIGEGTKIRLLRPRQCSLENEIYYQLCTSVKLNNGVPAATSGAITFRNAFKITRRIPRYENIITLKDVNVNIYDTNGEVIGTEIKNIPVSTPTNHGQYKTIVFNHQSPSDYFGNGCWGKGRPNTTNKNEARIRNKTEIMLGGAASYDGRVNYQHIFENSGRVSFDEQTFDLITGVVSQQNIILVICEKNVFTSLYDQQEVLFDSKTNQMYVNPAEKRFSKPRTKAGGEYGCSLFDVNTIVFHDGIVRYLNSRSAMLVIHNFDNPIDATPDGIRGYLREKISYNTNYNISITGKPESYRRFFLASVNPRTKEYIITSHRLMSPLVEYVNNEFSESIEKNETFSVDFNEAGEVKAFFHYTPEMYSSIYTASLGQCLISWANGTPYLHAEILDNNQPNTDEHMVFYGMKCKPVMTLIFNNDRAMDKNWLHIEALISAHKLYAKMVYTERGQISHIMPRDFVRNNGSWAAPFKTQTNAQSDTNYPNQTGVNSIEDGISLFGKWVKLVLVTEDENDTKYGELTGVIVSSQIIGKIPSE